MAERSTRPSNIFPTTKRSSKPSIWEDDPYKRRAKDLAKKESIFHGDQHLESRTREMLNKSKWGSKSSYSDRIKYTSGSGLSGGNRTTSTSSSKKSHKSTGNARDTTSYGLGPDEEPRFPVPRRIGTLSDLMTPRHLERRRFSDGQIGVMSWIASSGHKPSRTRRY
ncbi:uncharacterized protein L199_004160 [Kwoniella botswanensis]|uniref:uncharacterized protein n=1 Tax=Kwoniella botswanensis TaxID=1268659 RepID=UPI00315CDA4D